MKLKCQFHTLQSMKNVHSQARTGWVFLKEAWQMLWKCTARESNLSVFTQLFCWRTPCSSHRVPEYLLSPLKLRVYTSQFHSECSEERFIEADSLFFFFFNNMLDHDSLLATQPDLSWKAHFVVKEPRRTPKLHSTKSPGATHCSWKSNKSNGWDHTMMTSSLTTLLR